MADAYPKACFAFTVGDPPAVERVQVWGALDAVELSAGLWPNACQMRVPVHEFAKFQGDTSRDYAWLELYFSSPDAPDVVLDGWSVEAVDDSRTGKRVGQDQAEVVEKVLTLTDRRWEFLDGRGGHAFWGLVNRGREDGAGVVNEHNGFASDGISYFTAIHNLLGRMQYASGWGRMSGDDLPPALFSGLPKPRDLKWDGVHAPTEVQRLLDEADAVWLLRPDGTYDVEMIGDGELPSLPADALLPGDENPGRSARPGVLVVTSAPARAVLQRTEGVGAEGGWEWVAMDIDGALKPVSGEGRASWIPDGDGAAEDLVRSGYSGLSGEALQLARGTLFTVLRLGGEDRAKKLPILLRGSDTHTDYDGALRPVPCTVQAAAAQLSDDRWVNPATLVTLAGHRVDPPAGLISFPGLVGAVSGVARLEFEPYFVALGAGEIEVSWAHESREDLEGAETWRDFFAVGYRLQDEVVTEISDEDLAGALGPDGGDVRVLSVPELVEYRRLDGEAATSLNGAALKAEAEKLAARILSDPAATRIYRYRGLHEVSPHGRIPWVRWDLAAGTTSFAWRTYHVSASRYQAKQDLFAAGRRAAAASGGARAALQEGRTGAGDMARPEGVQPGRFVLPAARPGLLFGVIVAGGLRNADDGAYAGFAAEGDRWISHVVVSPCDEDGGNVDTGTTLTIKCAGNVESDHTGFTEHGLVAGGVVAWDPLPGLEAVPGTADPVLYLDGAIRVLAGTGGSFRSCRVID